MNHRKFFERFAAERGFDHLVPSNWYSTKIQEVLDFKVSRMSLMVVLNLR